MKKILCLLLVIVMLCPTVAVSAASGKKGAVYPFIPAVDKYYGDAKECIATGLRQQKKMIDISDYNISTQDVLNVYKATVFDNPDIFYVNAVYFEYQFNRDENKVYYIIPEYIFKKGKISGCINKFNNAVDELIDGIEPSWSDPKKALILHDRLAVNCEYKYQNKKSYTSYSAIVTRKSVCEGYARAYSYLLSLVGVDSKIINSEKEEHCWNMVRLSGKWYHVDVTADDPTPDTVGYVRHNYFLCSDNKLKSYKDEQHINWKNDITYTSAYKCSDTSYDSAYFRNVTSQIVCKNGTLYYMDNNFNGKNKAAFVKRNSKSKAVTYISDNWSDDDYSAFAKLCEKDGYIYYTTKKSVYRMELKSGKIKRVFTMPSFWKNNFYGISAKGDYIYAACKKEQFEKKSPIKLLKITPKNKVIQMPFLRYSKLTLKNKTSLKLTVYRGSGKIKYKSSDKKVAKVNAKGRVKAVRKGTCTVSAKRNGKTMKCKITVL